MIVQIYEIQTPKEAEQCIFLGVDHIGSVLVSGETWRIPTLREVMRLSEGTRARNTLIPLFEDRDTLSKALDYYRPHYVHFCHNLNSKDGRVLDLEGHIRMQSYVKERFPQVGIMRSIPVPSPWWTGVFPTLDIARSLSPVSDLFLADTWVGEGPVKGYIGITGASPNWGVARDLVRQSEIPVILAGGLSPHNVYGALLYVMPAGADSCTQTNELDPQGRPVRFQKDLHKVEEFVKEVRRAEKDQDHIMEGAKGPISCG